MAWRFRGSKKLVGGLRLNYSSEGGLGVSFGIKGARLGVNKKEVRTTLSIPSTGIINVERHSISNNGKKVKLQKNFKSNKSAKSVSVDGLEGNLVLFAFCSGTNSWNYEDNVDKVGNVTFKPDSIGFQWELDRNKRTHRPDEVILGGFRINEIVFRAVSYDQQEGNFALLTVEFEDLFPDNYYKMQFKGINSYIDTLSQKIQQYISTRVKNQAKSQQCFVATAVYGSFDCAEVAQLRKFRDTYLRKSILGRSFIEIYYQHGPKLASCVKKSAVAKHVIKLGLDVFIWFLKKR